MTKNTEKLTTFLCDISPAATLRQAAALLGFRGRYAFRAIAQIRDAGHVEYLALDPERGSVSQAVVVLRGGAFTKKDLQITEAHLQATAPHGTWEWIPGGDYPRVGQGGAELIVVCAEDEDDERGLDGARRVADVARRAGVTEIIYTDWLQPTREGDPSRADRIRAFLSQNAQLTVRAPWCSFRARRDPRRLLDSSPEGVREMHRSVAKTARNRNLLGRVLAGEEVGDVAEAYGITRSRVHQLVQARGPHFRIHLMELDRLRQTLTCSLRPEQRQEAEARVAAVTERAMALVP